MKIMGQTNSPLMLHMDWDPNLSLNLMEDIQSLVPSKKDQKRTTEEVGDSFYFRSPFLHMTMGMSGVNLQTSGDMNQQMSGGMNL